MGNQEERKYRVVIWGAGKFGQRLYENLLQWKHRIEVLGIADNDLSLNTKIENENIFDNAKLFQSVNHIFTPDEVVELYSKKLIDGVIIGVSDRYYDSVCEQLKGLGVSIFDYLQLFDIVNQAVSVDDVADSKLWVDDGQVAVSVLKDVYVGVDSWSNTTWIYTQEGLWIREVFNYPEQWNKVKPRIPMVTDSIDDVISGKVCVLARFWTQNYWHFLYEVVDKILALQEIGYDGKYMIFYKSYIKECIDLLNIPEDKIIWIYEGEYKRYRCEQVYCFEPLGGRNNKLAHYLCSCAKRLWQRSVI